MNNNHICLAREYHTYVFVRNQLQLGHSALRKFSGCIQRNMNMTRWWCTICTYILTPPTYKLLFILQLAIPQFNWWCYETKNRLIIRMYMAGMEMKIIWGSLSPLSCLGLALAGESSSLVKVLGCLSVKSTPIPSSIPPSPRSQLSPRLHTSYDERPRRGLIVSSDSGGQV